MPGANISLSGEGSVIAVRDVSLFQASDADSCIVAAKLVVDGGYRGVYGGYTSCKRT
jgi:hypothetical protein